MSPGFSAMKFFSILGTMYIMKLFEMSESLVSLLCDGSGVIMKGKVKKKEPGFSENMSGNWGSVMWLHLESLHLLLRQCFFILALWVFWRQKNLFWGAVPYIVKCLEHFWPRLLDASSIFLVVTTKNGYWHCQMCQNDLISQKFHFWEYTPRNSKH